MRFERFRSRLLLAIGLGSAAVAPSIGCGGSNPKSDAPTVDASKRDAGTDGVMPDGQPTIRRPFLVGASLRASTATPRADWTASLATPPHDAAAPAAPLDAPTRDALAAVWLRDALEEHASIAAFARFALHLLSVGAPPDLIAAAQRASVDEIRHARAAFALAQRYGGGDVGPAPLRIDDALGARSLAEIAEVTAEEGCVGETLGALLAAEQARIATDPTVQRILRGLARDELRHAELAWRFARWAIETGGDDVLAAVERGVARACAGTLAAARRTYAVDLDAWHAHGRVTCDEAHAIAAAGIAEVVAPALAALAATRGSPSRTSRSQPHSPRAPQTTAASSA
jgi:hypothetical protein